MYVLSFTNKACIIKIVTSRKEEEKKTEGNMVLIIVHKRLPDIESQNLSNYGLNRSR